MLLLDSITHDERSGRKTHVHAPRDNNYCDESLCPVGLVNWHGGGKYISDHKSEHANEHDPSRTDLRNNESSCEGGYSTRYCDRAELCHCQKRRGMSE